MEPITLESIKEKAVTHFEEGRTYKIINAKTLTAIDVNVGQSYNKLKEVVSWELGNGNNQKWKFEKHNNHWAFCSVVTKHNCKPRYLSVDLREDPPKSFHNENIRIRNHGKPHIWDICPDEKEEKGFRIFLNNGPSPGLNFDIRCGSKENGAHVILWKKFPVSDGGLNQVWYFIPAPVEAW